MNFKINEKVIYCPINVDILDEKLAPIAEYWGEQKDSLSKIYVNSKEVLVPSLTIRKYIPCDDIEVQFSFEVPTIIDMIQSTWESIFKNQREFKIKSSYDEINFQGLSISPCIYRSKTLTGVREFLGYELIEWRTTPATREQPEDVYDVSLGKYRNKVQVVSNLIKNVIGNEIDNYLEYLTMSPEESFEY